MSVFTPVDPRALQAWLAGYDIGTARALLPIAEGVENTNYFLDTAESRYVLTLFERLQPDALPFYLGLMRRLAEAGVACPKPVAARDGALFSNLCGKPAAVVSRLAGRPVDAPGSAHCAAIGDWLARMHRALAEDARRPCAPPVVGNPCGAAWRRETAQAVHRFLDAGERALLADAMQRPLPGDLPRGVVHADLFRDNALWLAEPAPAADAGNAGAVAPPRLSGVIDFYFAGEDALLFDLAVTANDWCQGGDPATLDGVKCRALLAAYDTVRPLTAAEAAAWPDMLAVAALRFWLSRLADRHLPRPGELVKVKDPGEYRRILAHRLAHPQAAPWPLTVRATRRGACKAPDAG